MTDEDIKHEIVDVMKAQKMKHLCARTQKETIRAIFVNDVVELCRHFYEKGRKDGA